MRTIKKNFLIVFLFIASVSTGVLALSTALRLREFRSPAPQETSALTPQCKIAFTINDTTPREIAAIPAITLTVSPTVISKATPLLTATTQPTKTPPTATPTVKQQTIGAPQTTTIPTQIPTVTRALTPTPATKTSITPAKTATQTKAPAPQLPVSGTNIPTIGAFLLGFLFLIFGVIFRPFQIEDRAKEQRKKK